MAIPKEPNTGAFRKLLGQIGPQFLRGVPDDLKEWIEIISQGQDDFIIGGDREVILTLMNRWGRLGPRKAVEEALSVWEENVKIRISKNGLLLHVYARADRLDEIADGVELVNRQELIDRLVKAAMTPIGETP